MSGIAAMLRFPMPELEDEDEDENQNGTDDSDSDNWFLQLNLDSSTDIALSFCLIERKKSQLTMEYNS